MDPTVAATGRQRRRLPHSWQTILVVIHDTTTTLLLSHVLVGEFQKLHQFAGKGMSLKAIAKALTRSEESVKDRAKADGLTIAKLR